MTGFPPIITMESKVKSSLGGSPQKVKSETKDDVIKSEDGSPNKSLINSDLSSYSDSPGKLKLKSPSSKIWNIFMKNEVKALTASIEQKDSNAGDGTIAPSSAGDGALECSICRKTYRHKKSLKRHIKTHEKLLECEICLMKFAGKGNLRAHMYSHQEEKNSYCFICEKKFARHDKLKTHLKFVHSSGGKPTSVCPICKKECPERNLNRHIKEHGEKLVQCPQCNKKFHDASALRKHAIIHREEKPFECSMCGKKCKLKSNLTIHMRNIHSETKPSIICPKCHKAFSSQDALTKHIRAVHDEERNFKCDVCESSFLTKAHLKRHMNIHSTKKNYTCPKSKCSKVFSSGTDLKIHIVTHKDSKVFECLQCGKKFLFNTHLVRHKEWCSQSYEKPYKCSQCSNAFKKEKNLKRHFFKFHKGEQTFKCSNCDEVYVDRSKYEKHILIHSEQQYKCVLCPKTYTHKPNLDKHFRKHDIVCDGLPILYKCLSKFYRE